MSSAAEIPAERVAFVKDAFCATVKDVGAEGREKLVVTELSGGITNQLYRVRDTSEGAAVASVVVRIYGAETERLISREAEQYFQRIFLHTYGTYRGNTLVYQFLDGYRALGADELPRFQTGIAEALGHFVRTAGAAMRDEPKYAQSELHAVNLVTGWRNEVVQALQQRPDKLEAHRAAVEGKLVPACAWMAKLLARIDAHMRAEEQAGGVAGLFAAVLFATGACHNDLLCGNIMVRAEATRADDAESCRAAATRLIDFEYCKRNYLLFDVGNHWNEWAGYDNDFSKYPSEAQQRKWVADFLRASGVLGDPAGMLGVIAPSDELIAHAVATTNFFGLVSSLGWAAWSLVQHAYSPVQFDYVEYFHGKYNGFLHCKQLFLRPFLTNVLKLSAEEAAALESF